MTPTGWSTWNPERPAELSDLTSGFRLTPVLYSDRAASFTQLPPGPQLRLGLRTIDGGRIEFETLHEDTRLAWSYDLDAPDGIAIEWHRLSSGEWGLRFWVTLCLSGPEGTRFIYDRESGRLQGFDAAGEARLEIRAAKDPLLVTFHDSLEALAAEFENQGYFYLASRGTEGRFVALRFNLVEAPAMRLMLSTASAARPDLPGAPETSPAAVTTGPAQESLQAIHDVMAWNHVFDGINGRPYTALTRNWSARKFGGFGVWLNDVLYNALLWSHFDAEKARQNIEAVFAWQTEEGNFPCLVTGNDAWQDRSQPPSRPMSSGPCSSARASVDFWSGPIRGFCVITNGGGAGAAWPRPAWSPSAPAPRSERASTRAPSWQPRTSPPWTTRRCTIRRPSMRTPGCCSRPTWA